MAGKNLMQFIDQLRQENELIVINEPVDPRLEIAEITDRISKSRGKALLFVNNGTGFPVLMNMYGSEKRMCLALGVSSLDEIGQRIDELLKKIATPQQGLLNKIALLPRLSEIASWMPSNKSGRGECQQIIMETPDLSKLPVITCWPYDGGPFITLPMVHTVHPETGMRNMGMYRMQVFNNSETGMHWHLHKNSAAHFREYKKLGKRMPVAVALGGDPVYTYCATAPLPENVDEYMLAGFLRKKKVELVKCLTSEIRVPADADIIIEGYVDPSEDLALEGPFGDHTGFYSLADFYPRFHVTCITHRENAVFPATIVGIPPQEDEWLGKATERIFLSPIRLTMLPEVTDMFMPVEGVFHNIVVVKLKAAYPGHAAKVINALWGAGQMMFNKIMIVVDEGTDLGNPMEIARQIAQNCDFNSDIIFTSGPMDVLDHSSRKFAFGTKIGFDATHKGSEITTTLKTLPDLPGLPLKKVNGELPFVIIPADKQSGSYSEKLSRYKEFLEKSEIRIAVMLDQEATELSMGDMIWIAANNIDPSRDITMLRNNCMLIDATSKSGITDIFDRDWPNVVTMDQKTIDLVDAKWEQYNLGAFIKSPSLKYEVLVKNKGAVAYEAIHKL